jgi:protein-disulfide isomerase
MPRHLRPLCATLALLGREVLAQQGDSGFWRYHDTLFFRRIDLTRANLDFHANMQGVDIFQFRRALDADAHAAAIQEDIDAAAAAGLEGTPNTLINGKLLRGTHSLEIFFLAIDAELKAP